MNAETDLVIVSGNREGEEKISRAIYLAAILKIVGTPFKIRAIDHRVCECECDGETVDGSKHRKRHRERHRRIEEE